MKTPRKTACFLPKGSCRTSDSGVVGFGAPQVHGGAGFGPSLGGSLTLALGPRATSSVVVDL